MKHRSPSGASAGQVSVGGRGGRGGWCVGVGGDHTGDLALIKVFGANQKQAAILDLGQSGIGHLNTIHQWRVSVFQCGGAPLPHADGSGGLLSCT